MSVVLDESGLPADRLMQPVTMRWFTAVFGASLLYAILRYHLAGDVSWDHFPLFILNKAASLAAVIFIACSYLIGPVIRWHNRDPRKLVIIKFCGLMGFSLAVIHACCSACLLTPAYFPKYFSADGRMNVTGELAMVLGIIALWALTMPAITTLPRMAQEIGGKRWKRNQRMGYLSLALAVAHLVVLGWNGWMAPSRWPSGLLPISLVAALVALTPLVAKRRRSRTK